MTRRRPALWIDAFADKPLAGNPCLVVFDADDVPVETRIALVRETNLSECAYMIQSDRADFGARYYTAAREIPMAGHPTIAAAAALRARGAIAPEDAFTLEVGAGVLPLRISADGAITMTQAAPTFGAQFAPEDVAPVFGLRAEDFAAPPETVSTGTPFLICALRDAASLQRATLNLAASAALAERADCDFVDPFLSAPAPPGWDADIVSRQLMRPPEPPEDPFTGSATGCMAAWRWARGFIETPDFVAAQGDWIGRPGRGTVRVLGERAAISGVELTGRATLVMEGEIIL